MSQQATDGRLTYWTRKLLSWNHHDQQGTIVVMLDVATPVHSSFGLKPPGLHRFNFCFDAVGSQRRLQFNCPERQNRSHSLPWTQRIARGRPCCGCGGVRRQSKHQERIQRCPGNERRLADSKLLGERLGRRWIWLAFLRVRGARSGRRLVVHVRSSVGEHRRIWTVVDNGSAFYAIQVGLSQSDAI
jgi:hypothetical protein